MAKLITTTFDQTTAYHSNAILPVLIHCLSPEQAPHRYIGAYQMKNQPTMSNMYLNEKSLSRTAIQIFHFILTLSQNEQTDLINQTQVSVNEALYKIADEIAHSCAKKCNIIYAVHEDTFTPHIHFVIINNNPIEYSNPYIYDGYNCEVFIRHYLYYHYRFQLHVSNHGEYCKNMQNLRNLNECGWKQSKDCIPRRDVPGRILTSTW